MQTLTLLDGAMGTELTRRGVNTALPLWSAHALDVAPEVVMHIHADYIAAGAQVVTANTFRTNPRALAKAGIAHRAQALTRRAVGLARRAIAATGQLGKVRVAGSVAPVEDCYSPELAPSDAELEREHMVHARHLAEAGVELILIETQNTIREAVAAARAAAIVGLPFWVSFVLRDPHTLLSGEALSDAARAVLPFKPSAVLVNCVPVEQIGPALVTLRALLPMSIAVGAYANVGHVDEQGNWTLERAVRPDTYAAFAQQWRAQGATIIGGCCGTTPEHIAALRAALASG